jgi:hypothetical protein
VTSNVDRRDALHRQPDIRCFSDIQRRKRVGGRRDQDVGCRIKRLPPDRVSIRQSPLRPGAPGGFVVVILAGSADHEPPPFAAGGSGHRGTEFARPVPPPRRWADFPRFAGRAHRRQLHGLARRTHGKPGRTVLARAPAPLDTYSCPCPHT